MSSSSDFFRDMRVLMEQAIAVPPKPGVNPNYQGSAGAQAIAKSSGIQNVNKIQAGQKITMPGGSSYTVQQGDTLDSIAKKNPSQPTGTTATTNAPSDLAQQYIGANQSATQPAQAQPAALVRPMAPAQAQTTAPASPVQSPQPNASGGNLGSMMQSAVQDAEAESSLEEEALNEILRLSGRPTKSAQSKTFKESVELNDSFDIELNEHFIIETGIVGFTEDGIILEADDVILGLLEVNDMILENEGYPEELEEVKPGLWANIHAKRERIKKGSGEKMRKPGSEGAPTSQAFKQSAKESIGEDSLDEAEYQGRKVQLGKPMAGDVKKSKVYVRKPNGKIVKVNFGDKKMKIKKSNPARRKSFRARHRCENPGPRWKARYWSCRAW